MKIHSFIKDTKGMELNESESVKLREKAEVNAYNRESGADGTEEPAQEETPKTERKKKNKKGI